MIFGSGGCRVAGRMVVLNTTISKLFCVRWCEYTELQHINKTVTCAEAKVELYASGWALDTHKTASLNHWRDDISVVVTNVDKELGDCVLFK